MIIIQKENRDRQRGSQIDSRNTNSEEKEQRTRRLTYNTQTQKFVHTSLVSRMKKLVD